MSSNKVYEEPVFTVGQYEVYVEPEVEALPDGKATNYCIYNSMTRVKELYLSTFVQAVSGALELFMMEGKLSDKIDELEKEESGPELRIVKSEDH